MPAAVIEDPGKENSAKLRELLHRRGATVVGLADVSAGLARELASLPRAVSLAVQHPPQASSPGEAVYDHCWEEVDLRLRALQQDTVCWLKARGYRYLAIPPDSGGAAHRFVSRLYPLFSHKTAATCAGLGWIGRNGLLINPRYGPRLSWATVLTDAPLAVSTRPYLTGRCGRCRACVAACPAGALGGTQWQRAGESFQPVLRVEACRAYLAETFRRTGKHLCGKCILVCPWGRPRATAGES